MASYVSPEIRDRFDTLSADLKNLILERNVCLNNMYDPVSYTHLDVYKRQLLGLFHLS